MDQSKSLSRASAPRRTFLDPTKLYAYTRIPNRPATIVDEPLRAVESAGAYIAGAMPEVRGALTGIASIVGTAPIAPPQPAPVVTEPVKTARPVDRIKVGGVVQAARLVKRVIPVYPALARQARVSGTVQLMAIIATDGTVRQLDVVSGHPLLVGSAVDAVRQWTYRPTLLNGSPVEVVSPIEVHFTLGQ